MFEIVIGRCGLSCVRSSCAAQISRVAGAIQGSIVDQSGSAIADASVTLRNQGTSRTRTMLTNAQGFFRAGASGRSVRTSRGISRLLSLREQCDRGVYREGGSDSSPADTSHSATANHCFGTIPRRFDPAQTTEATTIDHERIAESPVVSRNYLDFVLLAPQLTRSNIQAATGGQSALADSGFAFAGLRSRSNSLYIDGVENNDDFTGAARTELSPETVQEFQVVNNGLSAASGGGASGHINVITKSGVNTLHGDAFLFVQKGALKAKKKRTHFTPTGVVR